MIIIIIIKTNHLSNHQCTVTYVLVPIHIPQAHTPNCFNQS